MLDSVVDAGQYGTVKLVEAGEWELEAFLDDQCIGRIYPRSGDKQYGGESNITGAHVAYGTIADVAYNLAVEAYR